MVDDDDDIVIDKLRYINEYTNDLKQIRGMSKQQYVDDIIVKRAVERTFMNLIQSCIDLAQHIRASEGLSPSGTAKNEIESLGIAGILSPKVQEQVEKTVGFRNILAHRYGDVNHDIVYGVLHDDLYWFDQFQQEIAQWYQKLE